MTQDEIIEMARDTANHGTHANGEVIYTFYSEHLEAFAKLVAAKALAQRTEQEPMIAFNAEVIGYVAPQRTWVGLEGEEIRNLWEEVTKPDRSTMTLVTSFARAIEAKLKERNT